MGKIKQGILGGFSGKVAGVVGSSWKGIAVMKSLPLSVANPKTAGQVAQRGKFSNVVAFSVIILSTIIKPLWDRFASGKSGFNSFISTNIDLFAAAMPGAPADLLISKGKMAATVIDTAVASEAGVDADISWTDDSGSGFKLATDIAFVVLVNLDDGLVQGYETEATRADGTVNIPMSEKFDEGVTAAAYLAFRRADGTIVSNTAYSVLTVGA